MAATTALGESLLRLHQEASVTLTAWDMNISAATLKELHHEP